MTLRKPIIAANWKMNKGPAEASEFVAHFKLEAADLEKVEIVIAAPFIALSSITGKNFAVAAQNCSDKESGAYTGEISVSMLKEVGVEYVLTGHSERRSLYGETDLEVNAKNCQILDHGLKPIFCIGETLAEREAGNLKSVLKTQVTEGLKGICNEGVLNCVVAYEPVWAIGTGVTASPEQAQEAHAMVRGLIAELYTPEIADQIRIQYGGSMKPANADELLGLPDIDGGLVGGAALDPESFLSLVRSAVNSVS